MPPSLSCSCKNRRNIHCTIWMVWCAQVREIEEVHVSDLSIELFEERYAYTHRPLVVRNASIFWEALQVTWNKWSIWNNNVNFKVIDYNWLKAEYMKKPEEMDKTGEECWFNRFYRLKFTSSNLGKIMIGFTEDYPLRYKTNEFRNLRSVFKLPEARVKMESGGPW